MELITKKTWLTFPARVEIEYYKLCKVQFNFGPPRVALLSQNVQSGHYREGTFDNHITVCTLARIGGRSYIDIEFEAFPRPNVTWILQNQIGRRKIINEGDQTRRYRSYNLRVDVSKNLAGCPIVC